ncbi:TPA: hypothetical protein ACTZ2N_005182 [Bacillus cereus]
MESTIERRRDIQKLAHELWCKLDTSEEQSVLHNDEDVMNENEIKIYDALEHYLKAEGVFSN